MASRSVSSSTGHRLGHAIAYQGCDLVRRKSSLPQDLETMLVQARREPLRLSGRFGPFRRYPHAADLAFARMIDDWKEIGRDQMLILQNAFEIVHGYDRDVRLVEQFGPLRRGFGFEDAGQFGINRVNIGGAPGEGCELRIAAPGVSAGRLQKFFP